MNDDNYVEWLVKRKDPAYAVPVEIPMIVVYIFSVLSAPRIVFGVIVVTIAGVAIYFAFLDLSVGSEYLFAEGGLSAGRILGRAKRKKIFDCEKDGIQIVAPADSFVLKGCEKQGMKIEDLSLGKKETEVYTLIYQKRPDHPRVLIGLNEGVIGVMHRAFPWKSVI